ncbi:hypothetical protein E5206_17805 [Arthrobacter sp. PAMC25564]|uniref:hypothetical protein n=1 Tax=Arthrobacter sp. PAMC25564 TaxID=2565366 RepID=UPI0010A20D6C|nr:hypothetical protein [Arthrobacter sp. PAMC25564]QCB98533.1 hypothetical protein E5206_17805 [Arthrobacter sp. PAMC25564]
MNPPKGFGDGQRSQPVLSDAAKASLLKTHTLFRIFVLTVLGSVFVFQLDINYLWLTAILTAAGIVLGIVVLIRALKYRESRLVLLGTIAGMVASVVMVLVILGTTLFFNQFRDFQQCVRHALTLQAASECRTQLQNSMPGQLH